jgi:putative protease
MHSKKPELLSPAGDWYCVRAAVANGADAIYFGLPKFNARLRAENFQEKDLAELMAYLHQHGCKGYVTMNVLIFTGEMEEAVRLLKWLYQCGVDAVIIQDLGLAWLAKQIVPELAVHASTQMTITSPEGIAFAEKLGINLVVLSRELSLRELEKFQKASAMDLEVFVHGALCVAYSGQCLTSEALGQRSANRGECAQACRMPYQLIVDGEIKDLGDRKYLLSPQDLAAIQEIPDLIRLGIKSFKIEGRLKSPEYVAAVTRAYRKAIDTAWNGKLETSDEDRYALEMTFSRGFFSGWFHGVNHQKLVHARFGKKRGAFVGFVEEVGKDFVQVNPQTYLKPGDGVCFDTGEDTNNEQGGRIYQIAKNRLYFQHGKIDFSQIKSGHRIWKTDDPQLNKQLRQSYEGKKNFQKQQMDIKISGCEGKPLVIEAEALGKKVVVESKMGLSQAKQHPLNEDILQRQLGRLGDTTLELHQLKNFIEGDVILPVSELNRLRREIVEGLLNEPLRSEPRTITIQEVFDEIKAERKNEIAPKPDLIFLCRSLEQMETVLQEGIRKIYADFEDIRHYREAVAGVRKYDAAEIFLTTPRIQKAGEQGFFKLIEGMNPDGVLVRNLGAIHYFKNSRCVGDFSLNVANPVTARLLKKEGLEFLTISYDLNIQQVLDLLQIASPQWFEITLHQHMPMFHMEHCVFAAFLSNGTNHTNCGRPCDRHQVKLRDRVGVEHTLKADVGCRNTLFHAKAQTGASYIEQFLSSGLRRYRVELLNEDKFSTQNLVRAYKDLLGKKLSPQDLLQNLKIRNQLGVTEGTLEVKA